MFYNALKPSQKDYVNNPFKPPSKKTVNGGYINDYEEVVVDEECEVKFKDQNCVLNCNLSPAVQVSTNQNTGYLCGISEGADEDQRVGRKIVITSIHARGEFAGIFNQGTTVGQTMHLWLILDTQCNGQLPTSSEVFSGEGDCRTCFMDTDNMARFKVIRKLQCNLNSGGHDGVTPLANYKAFEFFDLCNIPIVYGGPNAGVSQVRTNNLFLAWGSSSQILSRVLVRFRISYIDC
jgi:hypothetical protein